MWIAGVKSRLYYQMAAWWNGIHSILKICRPYGLGGSSPSAATKIMKKKTNSTRNGFAIPAKKRKAGEIRSKKDKRKNGKNKQSLYLGESY